MSIYFPYFGPKFSSSQESNHCSLIQPKQINGVTSQDASRLTFWKIAAIVGGAAFFATLVYTSKNFFFATHLEYGSTNNPALNNVNVKRTDNLSTSVLGASDFNQQPSIRITPDQTTPGQTTPGQTTPDQTTPDQTTPDQTTPDQTTPDQTTPDQTTPDQTTPDQITPGPVIDQTSETNSLNEIFNLTKENLVLLSSQDIHKHWPQLSDHQKSWLSDNQIKGLQVSSLQKKDLKLIFPTPDSHNEEICIENVNENRRRFQLFSIDQINQLLQELDADFFHWIPTEILTKLDLSLMKNYHLMYQFTDTQFSTTQLEQLMKMDSEVFAYFPSNSIQQLNFGQLSKNQFDQLKIFHLEQSQLIDVLTHDYQIKEDLNAKFSTTLNDFLSLEIVKLDFSQFNIEQLKKILSYSAVVDNLSANSMETFHYLIKLDNLDINNLVKSRYPLLNCLKTEEIKCLLKTINKATFEWVDPKHFYNLSNKDYSKEILDKLFPTPKEVNLSDHKSKKYLIENGFRLRYFFHYLKDDGLLSSLIASMSDYQLLLLSIVESSLIEQVNPSVITKRFVDQIFNSRNDINSNQEKEKFVSRLAGSFSNDICNAIYPHLSNEWKKNLPSTFTKKLSLSNWIDAQLK